MASAKGVHNGLWQKYFLVVGIIGSDVTSADVREWLRANGEDVSRDQVRNALNRLCSAESPVIEKSVRGRPGYARLRPSRYRLTERGRAVFAED